ncbi:MAG: hypothetical protein ACYC66_02230 [Chloroflexota bacterium]
MTTSIAGNRMMGFTLGVALLMLGVFMTAARMPMVGVNWASGTQAAPSSAPQLDIKTQLTPDPVEALDRITVATTFRASTEVREPLVAHLEVVGATQENPALVMSQSGFRVPAGGARAVYWEWRVPDSLQAGVYTLRVQVMGQESGKSYGEEQRAAMFRVVERR